MMAEKGSSARRRAVGWEIRRPGKGVPNAEGGKQKEMETFFRRVLPGFTEGPGFDFARVSGFSRAAGMISSASADFAHSCPAASLYGSREISRLPFLVRSSSMNAFSSAGFFSSTLNESRNIEPMPVVLMPMRSTRLQ